MLLCLRFGTSCSGVEAATGCVYSVSNDEHVNDPFKSSQYYSEYLDSDLTTHRR